MAKRKIFIKGDPQREVRGKKLQRESEEMMRQARPMMRWMKYIKYFMPLMIIAFIFMILMFIPGSPVMGWMMKNIMGNMFKSEAGAADILNPDSPMFKKMMENMETNPEWMKSMIEQHPEMLEGVIDERMMKNMMNADTIETMITAMPPETMNKMMAQMMKDNPAMLQDMMTDMIKNNPQMLQSMFSNMDEATMNQMFSTIMKDYNMVMTGGEMVIKLPPDTAKLIGHEYVVVEITSDMGMKDMQFSMQKKQNT